jgi:hypothetical protein
MALAQRTLNFNAYQLFHKYDSTKNVPQDVFLGYSVLDNYIILTILCSGHKFVDCSRVLPYQVCTMYTSCPYSIIVSIELHAAG